jgi:hypothetical protein
MRYTLSILLTLIFSNSFSQIPVLNIEKNIFKMDSSFEKEALSKSYYRAFNRWIRQADFDNDGNLDYLLQPYQNKNRGGIISVLYNKSTNSKIQFINTSASNLYSEGDPALFDVGDVDGDNDIDILIPTQNYHGTQVNKELSWYTTINEPDHTYDKLFLNNQNGTFTKILFPDNFNTESGRLLNIDNSPQKEILITNYYKPKDADNLHQDENLLYNYKLINNNLIRNTTFRGNGIDVLPRIVQADELGDKIYFSIEKRMNDFKDSIFVVSFKKGDSLSLLNKHDTIAIISPSKIIKGDYSYNYLPVIDFGIHIVDLDKDGIIEVVTQEATQIKDATGKTVEPQIGISHTRIQVYNKTGNISNKWLDSTLQYDPQRISHGNGIKLADINNDGLIDIVPVGGYGWWAFTNGDTTLEKERSNKRVLLNTGRKIESFNLFFKNQSDLNYLNQQMFFYPIFINKNSSGSILFIKEGGETSNTSFDGTNGVINLDFSQFKFPCDEFGPEFNFRGSLAIPYGKSSTTLYLDSTDGIKTTWYKGNDIISNYNSSTFYNEGVYKVKRINLSGCTSEKEIKIIKSPQVVVKTQTTNFVFSNLPNDLGVENNGQGIGGALNEATSGALMYTYKGKENIIVIPSYSNKPLSPLHFVKENEQWNFKKYYSDITMGNARNYVFIDSITIAYADHGLENGNPWPYGDIYTVKNQGDTLNWKKISKFKSFYHSVGQGDINNDGLYDLIGLHMGSYNEWKGSGGLHPYTQKSDGNFIENDNIVTKESFPGENTGQGSVVIADLLGDKRPEIIKAQYGGDSTNPYAYAIFAYNETTKLYQCVKTPINKGVFEKSKQGSTSIKFADFNKDGFIDMAIASEGYPGGLIQIWDGKGNGDFRAGQLLNYPDVKSTGYPDSANTFREFEIADVDDDGFLDIIVHPFHFGNKFRINPGPNSGVEKNGGWVGKGVYLNYSIWKNSGGVFYMLPDLLQSYGTYPGFMKGFYVNNKLRFFGFEQNQTQNNLNAAKLHEYLITFCKDLSKPNFNTSKFSFCPGDSLKLSITNSNKGDTLKWYFGTKSDLTNVTNKTFTDSTKLYVTRTDSVGCVISSDTIQLSKIAKPSSPNLSRDTENNLVANINGITWYKDGVKITDTTQKIKPSSNGNYTATTTQNGCTSAASANYYYLTSAVANLSGDEYFKISPNPTNGEIYLNYNIRSTNDVYINVIDISGRTIINNRKVNSGNKLNLGSSMKGNYIIQVKDKAGKLLTTEKLIKN